MLDTKETEEKISLHGLGFIQVKLEGRQRLHVWHPDLPRRKCFAHSSIHDHRFSFESTVLIGAITNIEYYHRDAEETPDTITHIPYLHKGPRGACGGRPWIPDGALRLTEVSRNTIHAGGSYQQQAFVYHQTQVASMGGKLATIMRKVDQDGVRMAHSLCEVGVEPEADFDRFQWSEERLWEAVISVLSGIDLKAVILESWFK